MIGLVIAVLVAALVYALCVALGLPAIVGIVAAILVLLAGIPIRRIRVRKALRSSSEAAKSRIVSSALRMRRETCICEMPIRFGDLGLGHVIDEAHLEDQPLALGQRPHRRAKHRAVLDELVARVLRADRLGPGLVVILGAG